ncbi:hypothetical protein CANCADRAFT_2403 [Tortispora caseinolytica NRRL Y-17796]|uniref:Uncharacterized protein n=1 Tax=Tortispora caseinolytica NRRL Y-17796 TaxID=767744 RepID=A0A1E4TG48_9ASCO|nr:hypothetical protein CANCADRAFT_2403 [Tortispora caseinolytica NRRL Y-17796]
MTISENQPNSADYSAGHVPPAQVAPVATQSDSASSSNKTQDENLQQSSMPAIASSSSSMTSLPMTSDLGSPVESHTYRRPWTHQEDQLLIEYIERNGPRQWVKASQLLKTRSPKQCRERYNQNLKPSLNRTPITKQEGQIIEELVNKVGRRWALITRHLGTGRSENSIKSWWNSGVNRRRRAFREANALNYMNGQQPMYDPESGILQPTNHMQNVHMPSNLNSRFPMQLIPTAPGQTPQYIPAAMPLMQPVHTPNNGRNAEEGRPDSANENTNTSPQQGANSSHTMPNLGNNSNASQNSGVNGNGGGGSNFMPQFVGQPGNPHQSGYPFPPEGYQWASPYPGMIPAGYVLAGGQHMVPGSTMVGQPGFNGLVMIPQGYNGYGATGAGMPSMPVGAPQIAQQQQQAQPMAQAQPSAEGSEPSKSPDSAKEYADARETPVDSDDGQTKGTEVDQSLKNEENDEEKSYDLSNGDVDEPHQKKPQNDAKMGRKTRHGGPGGTKMNISSLLA